MLQRDDLKCPKKSSMINDDSATKPFNVTTTGLNIIRIPKGATLTELGAIRWRN